MVKIVMSAVFAVVIAISFAGSVFAADIKALTAAAEAGDANAQYDLALMYEIGDGVEKDYAKVAEWMQKAAEQGHTLAQFSLANMYYNGKGVEEDVVTSYMWWIVGGMIDPGNETVKGVLEGIELDLTADQIKEAESKAKAKFEEIERNKK